MFRILFDSPEIPGNTGAAIRLAAITGAELHIVEPLGFDLDDTKLKRAGLDYHDLAALHVHPDKESAWRAMQPEHVYAFSADGTKRHTDIVYSPGDVLMFGRESVGLSAEAKADPRVTELVRIPMLPGLRSLNLANSASIALYEAWRQYDFAGAALTR